jgi:TRAP-type C4-dicarboxylate transport system substrate-binding protein
MNKKVLTLSAVMASMLFGAAAHAADTRIRLGHAHLFRDHQRYYRRSTDGRANYGIDR